MLERRGSRSQNSGPYSPVFVRGCFSGVLVAAIWVLFFVSGIIFVLKCGCSSGYCLVSGGVLISANTNKGGSCLFSGLHRGNIRPRSVRLIIGARYRFSRVNNGRFFPGTGVTIRGLSTVSVGGGSALKASLSTFSGTSGSHMSVRLRRKSGVTSFRMVRAPNRADKKVSL